MHNTNEVPASNRVEVGLALEADFLSRLTPVDTSKSLYDLVFLPRPDSPVGGSFRLLPKTLLNNLLAMLA